MGLMPYTINNTKEIKMDIAKIVVAVCIGIAWVVEQIAKKK